MISKEPKKVTLIDSSTKDVSEFETAEMARLRRENELLQEKIKSLGDPWTYRAAGLQALKENRVLEALGWFEKALVSDSSVISDDDMKQLPECIDLKGGLSSRFITDVAKIPEIQKLYSEMNIDVVIQGSVCSIMGEVKMPDEIRALSAFSEQEKWLGSRKQSALTVCAFLGHERLLRRFVDCGADLNLIDILGKTTLMAAGIGGYFGVLKYLIEEKKMEIHQLDSLKRNVLYYAVRGGNLLMVKYLIEVKEMDISQENSYRQTLIFSAIEIGSLPMVKYLVEEREISLSQPLLFIAACNGSLPLVKYLVEEREMDINCLTDYEHTILFYAVMSYSLHTVKYLVEQKGMNIHGIDKDGKNLLCYCNDPSIISYLLVHGLRLTPEQRESLDEDKLKLIEKEEAAYIDKVDEQQHSGSEDTDEKSESENSEVPTVGSEELESEQEMGSEHNNSLHL